MLQSSEKEDYLLRKERQIPEVLIQQDNQSCLICCLLMNYSLLTGKGINFRRTEKELFCESFGLYRCSYALSHLAAFTRRFNDVCATLWIDPSTYVEELSKQNQDKRISIQSQKINTQWVAERLEATDQPILLLVDAFHLGRDAHMLHWIYVHSCHPEAGFGIVDTGYGKERAIKVEELEHCLYGLKYQMNWLPEAISLRTVN